VSPAVRLEARPLQLQVEHLDQAAPDKQSSVILDTEIDQYGAVRLEGTLRPFGESLHMALAGEIDAFHLPSLSPYAARHLDYRIMQGHLDASLDWRVDNWQLDAVNDLKIAKLQVESLKDDRKSRLTEILGLRASTALSLLRDDEENIEIEVP
ncbi:MAG: DUF748 domain-containing protein, partial [Desulfuromonadales bacterium]|nr:DUF748 domain-containing protein [Desulfuromonadales bacterium]NIS43218.1 DUF748 domain-containing protein [Desulfuromonadales bacterium]